VTRSDAASERPLSQDEPVDDCYSCQHNAAADLPPREAVAVKPHWRVVHSFNSSLPGWLVLVPRQHVDAFDELSSEAMAEMGGLVGDLSRALREVVGCEKTYVMQFSEAPGFSHLHVHLVPRMPDQPADRRGPAVFGYLGDDESVWVPTGEMDRIAREIGAAATRN
jgi:diadenosine tetraphosphate (Ap4A) HIT family hydrolase